MGYYFAMHAYATYYNEFDTGAAAWLRNMIEAELIPPGVVDTRSITDVTPKDLEGFDSCHFFAGIGGWPIALGLAGWPDERPVWSGSCPCQSYSVAGKQKGDDDPRNLWPHFFRLISQRRPDCIFGEQVANAIRHGWLDGISADLEGAGYAIGACVLGAHSTGAPHIRQRLYWVAKSSDTERGRRGKSAREHGRTLHAANRSGLDGLADSTGGRFRIDGAAQNNAGHPDERGTLDGIGIPQHSVAGLRDGQERAGEVGRHRPAIASTVGWLGIANGSGPQPGRIASESNGYGHSLESASGGVIGLAVADVSEPGLRQQRLQPQDRRDDGAARDEQFPGVAQGDTGSEGLSLSERQELRREGRREQGRDVEQPSGAWGSYYVAQCRDGKARRVGTGIQPLAYGIPRSVRLLLSRLESLGIDPSHLSRKSAARLLKLAKSNRVTRLRGYGNAIVPALAAEFISAFLEVTSP
jgi:DNA (cytosine-5)-methyltransferase 1